MAERRKTDRRAAPSDALIVEITNISAEDGGGFNACIPSRGRWTTLGDGETEADALRDLANLMDPLPADALREAAQAMLDAVDIVDADGELDGRIDGTLIDNLRRALTTPPAQEEKP